MAFCSPTMAAEWDEDVDNYFKSLNSGPSKDAVQVTTTINNNSWKADETSTPANDFRPPKSNYASNNGYGGGNDYSSKQDSGFGGGNNGKPGDWSCDCGANNFARRTDCFKCHEPKPEGAGGGDSGGFGGFSNGGGGGGSRSTPGEGDWTCSCGSTNFASRYSCRQCKAQKPKDDNAGGGGGFGGGSRSTPGEGDWTCSCGSTNFASRYSCRQCKAQKPKDDNAGGGGGFGGGFGGGESRKRDGDWDCSCGQSNFASRQQCFKCSEPKPESAGGGFGDDGGSKPRQRDGDWNCSCGQSNFASRAQCFKCSEPKPASAGPAVGEDGKPREIYVPPPPTENEDEMFGSGISSGINFEKYYQIPVKVSEDAPSPIASFAAAGFRDFVMENVTKAKYTKPTPIQQNAIPVIMQKRDLMACAQTGSGKTAAFLLPIIDDLLKNNLDMSIGKPHVVIISPTRELAIQIHDEARKFAHRSFLKTALIYGGTSTKYQAEVVNRGSHILVATPGRLNDFVQRGWLTFEDVRYMVLDEADRMLDMGFMPEVEKVMKHPTMNDTHVTLMFSATFPEEIQRLAGQFLKNYVFISVGIVGGACTDVEQNFFEVKKFEKRNKLMEILDAEDPVGTIVFVETQRNADFLASFLSETTHPTTSIHGARLQRERETALNDFKNGRMKIMVATSVAARGLDIKNVRHVINYDLPKGVDDYVHRIGRTGRVGNKGKATSFYDPEQDSNIAADLVKILTQANQPVPPFLGSGGGGSYGGGEAFGATDIRGGGGNRQPAALQPAEGEEEW